MLTLEPSLLMEHGPSSMSRPVEELQPGPPLSQRTRGAVAGAVRDSKNLEKRRIKSCLDSHDEVCVLVPKKQMFIFSYIKVS